MMLGYGNAVAIDGGEIHLSLSVDDGDLSAFYDTGRSGLPYYGPYAVTPTFSDAALATANRTMKEDVTVRAIPILEVSNPQGGLTVTIGG